MNDSLRLSTPDLALPRARRAYFGSVDAAARADGTDPFNEQARLDVESGRRSPVLLALRSGDGEDRAIGAAIVGGGELDLTIHPRFRGTGHGDAAVRALLTGEQGELTAWSHGDHPAARALAARHGFRPTRTLYRLKMPLSAEGAGRPVTDEAFPPGRVDAFQPGRDETEWVELNARTFAGHPEQGRLTVEDLRAREAEDWFEPADFLIARDDAGRMIGYNWLKVETPGGEGEVYVLGVDPGQSGRGLGRLLMQAGLARLAERGCRSAVLYVDESNARAERLYRSLGFVTDTTDVQYTRPATPA